MTPQKPDPNKPLFNIEKIQGMLPHRYPFLLLDRVLTLEKGKSVTALKNVTYNEPFFQGHFPQVKYMPGVLVIEAMAQAGGILLYNSIPDPDTKLVLLSKINNAKFRRPVTPGDQLIFQVDLLKARSKFCQVHCTASVNEKIVAEAEILASLLDMDEILDQE